MTAAARLVLVCILALFGLVALAQMARADTVASTVVELKPLLDAILTAAGTVLSALATWAVTWFARKMRLEADDRMRGYLLSGVHSAVDYAINRLQVAAGTTLTVDLRSEIVAAAARYLLDRFPDAIERFGLAGPPLEDFVLARMPAIGSEVTGGATALYSAP